DCPVTPISEAAAKELDAMSASFQQGQQQLHDSLTAADFDRAGFARIQAGQAKAIGASATRYMQFLGDAAAALTPEQRQMFSRKGHAEQ
ncbi:MAG: Spy/CpxP family protein refolding chaperone, partial [Xanthomonadales bacterium]|nr:Spy/CpxP family protein refolding chaperone [Xanthomonadales bacterium]